MKAIVADLSVLPKLAFGELPEPKPEHNQALVKVAAVSLSRGEIAYAPAGLPDGASLGWGFAGIAEQPTGDGSGPKAGARVFGISGLKSSFTEQVAATASEMAELPGGVSFEEAATLPLTLRLPLLESWLGGGGRRRQMPQTVR